MKDLSLLLVGLVVLILGAEVFVRNAAGLSRRLGVPPLLIGLTVVAFGTSMPELMVSLFASFEGANGLALGNVTGSNLFNLLAILGICACVRPIPIHPQTPRRDLPFSLIGAVFLFLPYMLGGMLNRWMGALLLLGFFGITLYQIRKTEMIEEEDGKEKSPFWRLSLGIVLGLGALISGGTLTVHHAVALAESVGISQRIIAVTIVAVGTSLPELATSWVATLRGENDIAVGNVVGSNIFNIFLILGASSVISPIPMGKGAWLDCGILTLATLLFFVPAFRGTLGRGMGLLMAVSYVLYVIFILL